MANSTKANRNGVPLVGACHDDGSTGQPTHLAPRGVDFTIEIVTQIVQLSE